MKPNMFCFFAILTVIGWIIGLGVVLTPIFVCSWLFCVFASDENTLLWSAKKRKAAQVVMHSLIDEFGLNRDLYQGKMKKAFPLCIYDAVYATSNEDALDKSFATFQETLRKSLLNGIVWNAVRTVSNGLATYKRLNSIITFSKCHKRIFQHSEKDGFSIKTGKERIWFYPRFIIVETKSSFELVLWNQVSCELQNNIQLKEARLFPNNCGVQPVRIIYKHMNKDGSPDRRFKQNPFEPIYQYTPVSLSIATTHYWLSLKQNTAMMIIECFKAFLAAGSKQDDDEDVETPHLGTFNPESIMNTIS